jgi:hypothetical protein
VAHGIIEYKYGWVELRDDLTWLDGKGDCYVRVLHEVRALEQRKISSATEFHDMCAILVHRCPNIEFWCGRNLYNWKVDYQFKGDDPTCEETYGSVVPGKKWLYGWWPWLYARTHNKAIKAQGTDKDILLIDFVDVG